MKKRKQILKKATAPTIVVDGVRYPIPKHLFDLPDGELARVIRGYRPQVLAQTQNGSVMSPHEFCAAIEKLGLSQQKAGVFFGFSKRTGQRFALGEKTIPIAVVYLISEMLQNKTTPAELEKRFSKDLK